jgi:hypothetical protein
MSSLNWSDLIKEAGETASYEPLPDGDYDFKVVEASATTSQSGKTMFKIKAQVLAGPHANRLVWDNLVISPESQGALGMFFAKMSSLGLNREYFTTNPNAQKLARLALYWWLAIWLKLGFYTLSPRHLFSRSERKFRIDVLVC